MYMPKTLRLREETHEILERLRGERELNSYEELIRRLLVKSGEIEGFGKDPDLPKWEEGEDRARFGGE